MIPMFTNFIPCSSFIKENQSSPVNAPVQDVWDNNSETIIIQSQSQPPTNQVPPSQSGDSNVK